MNLLNSKYLHMHVLGETELQRRSGQCFLHINFTWANHNYIINGCSSNLHLADHLSILYCQFINFFYPSKRTTPSVVD